MKAVVLEIKNEKAAVLAEDGSIKRIPDNGYSIGQEIEIPQASAKSAVWTGCRRRFAAAAACAAMAVVVGGGLFYASETVFAYSTVDIKTDTGVIQLKLNRKDQLISITADHETDAELTGIISGLLQEHSSLDEAVAALSESIDSEAEISVQSSDCGHAADLREEVKKMMPAKPETAEEGTDTSADQTEKDTAAGEKSSLHTSAQNDHDVKAEDGRSVPSGKEKQDRYDALPSGMSGGIAAGMSDPADGEQVIPGNAKNAENDPEDPKMNDPEDSKMTKTTGKDPENAGAAGQAGAAAEDAAKQKETDSVDTSWNARTDRKNADVAVPAEKEREDAGMAVPADEEPKEAGKNVTEGNSRNDTAPEENNPEKIGSGGTPADSHFDAAENDPEAEPAVEDMDSAGRKQPQTSGNKNAEGQAEAGQPPR